MGEDEIDIGDFYDYEKSNFLLLSLNLDSYLGITGS
jgi:hypothetical protein